MKKWEDITHIGLFVVSSAGQIIESNNQFQTWFGKTQENVTMNIMDLLSDEQSQMKYQKFTRKLESVDHLSDWEIHFAMNGGEIRLFLMSGGFIDGCLHGSLIMPPENIRALQDVTQSINSELAGLHRENTRKNIDLRKANKLLNEMHQALDEKQKSINSDLLLAKQVQRALMSKNAKVFDTIKVHTLYSPASSLGGDLYDVKRFDNKKVGVFICDVSGHGIASSLVVSVLKYMFRYYSNEQQKPSDLLNQINKAFSEVFTSDLFTLFCTAFYMIIDLETMQAEYSSAGHPYPMLYRRDSIPLKLGHPNLPIGIFADTLYENQEVQFSSQDKVLLFTDGLEEHSEDSKSDAFKLYKQTWRSVPQYFQALRKQLLDLETLQHDDVCSLLIEFD